MPNISFSGYVPFSIFLYQDENIYVVVTSKKYCFTALETELGISHIPGKNSDVKLCPQTCPTFILIQVPT